MSTPRIYTILEYVAQLVAEQSQRDRFRLSQLQPAIKYKFPDFTFEAYKLAGLREFISEGEKAGYFKLVNTGDLQSAYFMPGPKYEKKTPPTTGSLSTPQNNLTNNAPPMFDPRRNQWMNLTMENMLLAERGDQIVQSMKNVEALSSEFDAFLEAQIKATPMYQVRGKIQRIRDFLRAYRTSGEARALGLWQVSRTSLRLPTVPPIERAPVAQGLIWSLVQGNARIDQVPLADLDKYFFAVLDFCREQMRANKSWDWVVGLDMLEMEARTLRKNTIVRRTGALSARLQGQTGNLSAEEAEIKALVLQLREAAGIIKRQTDTLSIYRTFADLPSLDMMLRFLSDRPQTLHDDKFVAYLDELIAENVASGNQANVRALANKAALLICARKMGLDVVAKDISKIRSTYDSVMAGARLMESLFGFIKADDNATAARYYADHAELNDESLGALFEDQIKLAARKNDVSRYRQTNNRADLWRFLIDFGPEDGLKKYARTAGRRDDQSLQMEMALLLLTEAETAEDKADVISRNSILISDNGLKMANNTLEAMSLQRADADIYNRYYEAKRLIERCMQLGTDRALSELK